MHLLVTVPYNPEINFSNSIFQTSTIDENFAGQTAENMKTRALSIATVMKIKM